MCCFLDIYIDAQSDACSSAYVAHDPLCPQNGPTPICTTLSSNPWIFNCRFEVYSTHYFNFFVSSGNVTTSTVSSFSTTNNNQQWISTTASPIFSPWLIGLMGGLGWDFRDENETEYYFFSCRYFVSIDDSSFDGIFSSTSFTFKTYYFLT
jgi:hypothetical protein